MKITKYPGIEGIIELKLEPRGDHRGYFMRTFDDNVFHDFGINNNWVQENHSKTVSKDTIRGLHLQLPAASEAKLIRCIRGKILDVFVDLREASATFGKWGSIELTEESFNMIVIPRGFAHGFCSLSENVEIVYKVDNYYTPDKEVGIIWNDPKIDIKWPTSNPILSEKDSKNISLDDFVAKYGSIKN